MADAYRVGLGRSVPVVTLWTTPFWEGVEGIPIGFDIDSELVENFRTVAAFNLLTTKEFDKPNTTPVDDLKHYFRIIAGVLKEAEEYYEKNRPISLDEFNEALGDILGDMSKDEILDMRCVWKALSNQFRSQIVYDWEEHRDKLTKR